MMKSSRFVALAASRSAQRRLQEKKAGGENMAVPPPGNWNVDTNAEGYGSQYQDNDAGGEMEVSHRRTESGTVIVENRSWMGKFGHGIRSLWATRITEDSSSSDIKIKTTLRELVIYIVFLILLLIVTFGMTSSKQYYYTSVFDTTFVQTGFSSIGSMENVWGYLQGALLSGLYPNTRYNNQSMDEDELGYVLYENKLLGAARLRQVRVRNNSCIVPDDFSETILGCYSSYDSDIEDKNPYGLMNGTAWTYQSAGLLGSIGSGYDGLIASYGSGGYVQELPSDRNESAATIAHLKENLWIDRGTRAVFIDFTVYNANINLFGVIRLVAEMPPTGGAVGSWTLRTVKLLRYVTSMDYFVLACEVMFLLFIIYYIIEEIIEIKKVQLAYFKSFWNILDLVVIVIAICCTVFSLYRTNSVSKKLDELLVNPDSYPDFTFLSFWQITYNSALAVMVFCCWVKVFKYISFNRSMTQMSSTLSKCAKDLAGFAVMFFIFFLAFAQLGYLLFGTQINTYSSVGQTVFTLFRLILGDFDFVALQQANRVLGPAYFVLFIFFVFFILLNMFLAIINDTYAEVKSDLTEAKNEFEMGDYFRKGAFKVLDKLNIKRDRVMDIQNVMHEGDTNADGIIDFDEWRLNMKQRGYADAEIEAVFAKYDADGDRNLSSDEQKQMQKALDREQVDIDKEYSELKSDDSAAGGNSEEMAALQHRVQTVETSIGGLAVKVEAVLNKLELIERSKHKRRESLAKLLQTITEAGAVPDETRRQQMLFLVKDELIADCDESGHAPPRSARSRPTSAHD